MRISDWSADVCSSDLFELDGRDTATISAEHSRQAVGRDDPEEDDDEEPTQFNRFAIGADYIHRINRVFFGIEGDAHRDDYFTSGDDDRDRTEFRFGLPIGYELGRAAGRERVGQYV